jgi:hypothetical protein
MFLDQGSEKISAQQSLSFIELPGQSLQGTCTFGAAFGRTVVPFPALRWRTRERRVRKFRDRLFSVVLPEIALST